LFALLESSWTDCLHDTLFQTKTFQTPQTEETGERFNKWAPETESGECFDKRAPESKETEAGKRFDKRAPETEKTESGERF